MTASSALILVYTGRVYFGRVFRDAFRWRPTTDPDDPAVLAARLFLAAAAITVALLAWMGQDWLVAIFYTLLLIVLFWYSFLLGWATKGLVVRFGGNRVCQGLKPFFIGLIAGELCAGGFTVAVDLGHLWTTGHAPPVTLQLLPD